MTHLTVKATSMKQPLTKRDMTDTSATRLTSEVQMKRVVPSKADHMNKHISNIYKMHEVSKLQRNEIQSLII